MLFVSLVAVGSSVVQEQKKNQLEGVWKIVEEVAPSTNPADKSATTTNSSPQPSLLIFTKGHYSMVIVTTEQPRTAVAPAKDPSNLTDAEKIARFEQWRGFAANSGTYEIKGSTLSVRPIVAKGVNLMARKTPVTWEFKMEGPNSLWLIPTGQSPPQPRVKLTRLESNRDLRNAIETEARLFGTRLMFGWRSHSGSVFTVLTPANQRRLTRHSIQISQFINARKLT